MFSKIILIKPASSSNSSLKTFHQLHPITKWKKGSKRKKRLSRKFEHEKISFYASIIFVIPSKKKRKKILCKFIFENFKLCLLFCSTELVKKDGKLCIFSTHKKRDLANGTAKEGSSFPPLFMLTLTRQRRQKKERWKIKKWQLFHLLFISCQSLFWYQNNNEEVKFNDGFLMRSEFALHSSISIKKKIYFHIQPQ